MVVYKTDSNFEPVYKIESYETIKSDGGDVPIEVEESSMCQTFGMNYYPNDWTRLQLNYVYRAEKPAEESPVARESIPECGIFAPGGQIIWLDDRPS